MATIGFAGCSFTHGAGLDYYFGSRETTRFSHLVASHFNAHAFNQSFPGGSHTKIISWWKSFLEHQTLDAFVFQFTRWTRSDSLLLPGVSHIDLLSSTHAKFFHEWARKNNSSVDDYIEQAQVHDVLTVLNFLQQHEHKFPIYILCWPHTTLSYIQPHSWLMDRLITLSYQGETYKTIGNLMDTPLKPIASFTKILGEFFDMRTSKFDTTNTSRPELTIATDYVNFKKPRNDYHPSKLCHEVIASNIIDRLTHDNLFQNNR